jgi:hypothetical protein
VPHPPRFSWRRVGGHAPIPALPPSCSKLDWMTISSKVSSRGPAPLRRFNLPVPAVSLLLLLLFAPALRPQAPVSPPATPASIESNRKALNTIFQDYWEDRLKNDPEFASTIGDKRYNDQIDDYSVRAVNAKLEREQALLMRLAAIDPAGLTNREKTSRELLLRLFAEGRGGRGLQGVGDARDPAAAASRPPTPASSPSSASPPSRTTTTGSPACTPSPKPSTR